MPYASDRAASRFARDRDVLPDGPRVGPYESPYDVRRGYDQPPPRALRRRDDEPTLFFLGRVDDEVEEKS
jgi:hypothetical protein